MKIALLDSALPVRFGHPGQRVAHARWHALAEISEVRALTIDCWNREWSARGLLRVGDRLYPHAHRGSNREVARGLRGLKETPDDADTLVRAAETGWSSPRRTARLSADIAAFGADLVLVGDPMLFALGARLAMSGQKVAYLDNGLSDWMRHISTRLKDSEESRFCTLLADRLDCIRPTFGSGHFFGPAIGQDQVTVLRRTYVSVDSPSPTEPRKVSKAAKIAVAKAAAPVVFLVEQEQSDLFLTKVEQILVVATGHHWLDRYQIELVCAYREYCAGLDISPSRIVMIGFDPDIAKEASADEMLPRWTRLHTMIGVSQVLFLPCLTPALRPFVQAALSVGTFVVTRAADIRICGLAPVPGLYGATKTRLLATLASLVSATVSQMAYPPHIARAAARSPYATRTPPTDLAAWLARSAGTVAPPRVSQRPASAALPCRVPVIAPPKVLYTPVTGMLMLQLQIHGWSEIEEVRLMDDTGAELTRLAVSVHQQSQKCFLIEGGIVTALAPLKGALRIACHRDVEEVYTARIPVTAFETVACGLSCLEVRDGALTGTLWTGSEVRRQPYSLTVNGQCLHLSEDDAFPISDLGIDVVTFRTEVPGNLDGLFKAEINRLDPTLLQYLPLPQKPLEDHMARFNCGRRASAEVSALHGIHSGRRAWIIGNGPSVRHDDLARIPSDDIVFCFNRFHLSYGDTPLREDYVVSADTLMIQDFGQEIIEQSNGLPLLCIVPHMTDGLVGDFVLLPPSSTSVPIFSLDPTRWVSVGGSSVFVALQMAWHMGIRDVALYGMDYSFSARLQRDPRYPFPVSFDEGNHFIKAYRSAKPWCPPTWRDIAAGFLNARVAFEASGGRIVNTSRGGRLETFERMDFDRFCRKRLR